MSVGRSATIEFQKHFVLLVKPVVVIVVLVVIFTVVVVTIVVEIVVVVVVVTVVVVKTVQTTFPMATERLKTELLYGPQSP